LKYLIPKLSRLPLKKKQADDWQFISLFLFGAGGENRTRMYLRTLDFESSASTYFTTPAVKIG
jgi:hypothetical protein